MPHSRNTQPSALSSTSIDAFVASMTPILVNFLQHAMTTLTQAAPDLLIGWSTEKAPSSQSQLYIDCIHLIKQANLSTANTQAAVQHHTARFIKATTLAGHNSILNTKNHDLALADIRDIEYKIALEKTCQLLLEQHANTCLTLGYSLIKHYDITCADAALPFHPTALINTMLQWLHITQQTDISTKIAILKLIEQLITFDLLFAETAQCFKALNISIQTPSVPKFIVESTPTTSKRNKHTPPNSNHNNSSPHNSNHLNSNRQPSSDLGASDPTSRPNIQAELQHNQIIVNSQALLHTGAPIIGQLAAISNTPLTALTQTDGAKPLTLSTDALLEKITTLQLTQAGIDEASPTPQLVSVDAVRSQLRQTLASNSRTVQTISRQDTDVINLVSALFSTIFDDLDIPNSIKIILSRLQLPLYHVALADIALFETPTHPARKLLNLLAKLGMHWDDSSHDKTLYSRLNNTVMCVIETYTGDLTTITSILQELTEYSTLFFAQNNNVSKKTATTATQQDKLNHYKNYTASVIKKHLDNTQLPLCVVKLIHLGWRNVLLHIAIRHGIEHKQWHINVGTLSSLIWSVTPQSTPQWRKNLERLSPRLINDINVGLNLINFDTIIQKSFLEELGAIHANFLLDEPLPISNLRLSSSTEACINNAPDSAVIDIQPVLLSEVTVSSSNLQCVILDSTNPSSTEGALANNHPCVELVSQLPLGSIIDLHVHSTSQQRVKLIARLYSTDTLVFGNMRGLKVVELALQELAMQFNAKSARIIDQSLDLFDKALLTLINTINANNDPIESPTHNPSSNA